MEEDVQSNPTIKITVWLYRNLFFCPHSPHTSAILEDTSTNMMYEINRYGKGTNPKIFSCIPSEKRNKKIRRESTFSKSKVVLYSNKLMLNDFIAQYRNYCRYSGFSESGFNNCAGAVDFMLTSFFGSKIYSFWLLAIAAQLTCGPLNLPLGLLFVSGILPSLPVIYLADPVIIHIRADILSKTNMSKRLGNKLSLPKEVVANGKGHEDHDECHGMEIKM